jgi:hypothetical protein
VLEAPAHDVLEGHALSGNQQDPDMICEVFVLAENSLLE